MGLVAADLAGRCSRAIGLFGLALMVVPVAGAAPAAADVVVDSNLSLPVGLVVDGSGNVFIADSGNNRVVEDAPNGHGFTQSGVDSNLNNPQGVTVDSSGDVFIADTFDNRVVENRPLRSGGFTQSVVDGSLSAPGGVAVDGWGDVFIADTNNSRVVEDKPDGSGGFTQSVLDSNLNFPGGVVVDGSGDVFIADTFNSRVVEDKPDGSGGFTQSLVDSNLNFPEGVAVDSSGHVFIADSGNSRVVEDTPNGHSGFSQTVIDSGVNAPEGVAVDGSGNVFISDTNNSRLLVHPVPPQIVSAASLGGTPTDGQTLHLNFEFSSPAAPLAHAYQWRRCSDQAMTQNCVNVGSNSRSYKLSSADVGRYITAEVTATDQTSQSANSTSPADGPIANPNPPSVVTHTEITGPTEDGQVVRATGYAFSSPDSLVYHYRWQRCSDFAMTQNCVSVGDGHLFYLLSSGDVRRFITATVTATDREGQSTSSTSPVLGPIAPPDPPAVITQTTVAGTAQQGHSLAAAGYEFSSPDTLGYRYQWQRCSDQSMSQNCVGVGSNSKYYRLSAGDVGGYVTVTVTATDQESQSTSSTSAPDGPIS